MPAKMIRSTDPIAVQAVTMLLYGQPGSRKTSIAQTSVNPLTLDFDQGAHRAFGRKDSVRFDAWPDVLEFFAAGLANPFSTIVVDTVGRLLDLMSHTVVAESPKNGNRMGGLSLQGFGVLKTRFAFWLSAIRQSGKDVVLLSHEKQDKDGDSSYYRPDIQGGSYAEVMKLADMAGYSHFANGNRVLDFAPTDTWMAKGPSQWQPFVLPDFGAEPQFLAKLIADAKACMGQLSNESAKVAGLVDVWRTAIAEAKTAEAFTAAVQDKEFADLPKAAKAQVWSLMKAGAESAGLIWDSPAKAFRAKEVAA